MGRGRLACRGAGVDHQGPGFRSRGGAGRRHVRRARVGEPGKPRAAGYIIERLKKYGLHGGGPKGSFYQSFGTYNNILATFDGSDPELKDQVIVIGAHYDHVGYGNSRNSLGPTGFIHNGADDNASGVAGLLEVAEAISLLPERPSARSCSRFGTARSAACSARSIGSAIQPCRSTAYRSCSTST